MLQRRGFLQSAAAFLAACAGGSATTTIPTSDSTGGTDTVPSDTSGTGTSPEYCRYDLTPTSDKWRSIKISAYPDLATVGGYAVLPLGANRIIVAQIEAGCFVAIDAICSHQRCEIKFDSRFVCPCHGSQWDPQGHLLGGPAVDQEAFPVVRDADGDTLWIEVLG